MPSEAVDVICSDMNIDTLAGPPDAIVRCMYELVPLKLIYGSPVPAKFPVGAAGWFAPVACVQSLPLPEMSAHVATPNDPSVTPTSARWHL